MSNNDDDSGDSWYPLLGDMNPMTMPFGGFRMMKSMIGKGASQTKAATEWVMDQGQDALPTFPVQAIALKVFKPTEEGIFINLYQMFGSAKQPKRIIAYIPELHAHIPQWKAKKLSGLEEEERLKHNKRILSMISDGGGAFVISPDTPAMENIEITAGDFLLVDYQDRKNFSGGRVLELLDKNKSNFLPPEWAQPGTTPTGKKTGDTSADPQKAFKEKDSQPLQEVLPESVLEVPPAVYDNELLDPDIPPEYRPFLHPLNGVMAGWIHSPTYVRNDRSGTHAGIDLGKDGIPIYAMADGYVAYANAATGQQVLRETTHRYGKGLEDSGRVNSKGKKIMTKSLDSGMSAAAGWYVELVHWPEKLTPDQNKGGGGQGFRAGNSVCYGTRYLHLKEPPLVKKHQKVKKGQIIGYVGGTPWFSPHLHLDVVYKGVYVDPGPYCFLDIDAIAMIEDFGDGAIRNNDPTPGASGFCRKTVKGNKGQDLRINYRVGKFLTGQQYISPSNEKNPYSTPGHSPIDRKWYKPVSGNPLTQEELTYAVNQPLISNSSTENPTATDAPNTKEPGISNSPQQSPPATAKE
jgi:murein DD-endopeptidase MepM/ murein hydrolase activator NlpD